MSHGVIHSTVVREFGAIPESSPEICPESSPESRIQTRFRSDLEGTHMTAPPAFRDPMPVSPGATVTNLEAPFPPADPPLPVFVPPSVTDPVSNLDFLPVDDAFALEMRSESIEQLVGGDALRRGESERIEAGRSQTNADLVTGRDRVRVQDTLHEHTGHGLAEQAAHLHTTVDGTLDVHATSEDTVLLAGHMRELWDGGAAIVAAMTDDTVGGGGIRVTTPLDLWVHGLMGVEERIGTCTADAVLLELGATHYEREYGPGAHAAGLAVYTGSLYQSSRSTFRPLMRVKSGVRNLIAGGGGGGGGGDAGAGGAPAASPPPASAAGGAGTQAASETLCAATGAGGTARAGGMAGVRSQDLTGIHRGDEVAAFSGGAHVAGTSGDLTGLRRGEDTAGQLAALRDAMRGGEADLQREVTSVSRVPGLDDTASVHEASALDIVGDIRSGATVPDLDAPVLNSTVSPPQPPPGVTFGLLGGADRPPQPAAPESDFLAVLRDLREHRSYFNLNARTDISHEFQLAIDRITKRIVHMFDLFAEPGDKMANRPPGVPNAEYGYRTLQKWAELAEMERNFGRAGRIRPNMRSVTKMAARQLQTLRTKYEIGTTPTTLAMQRLPATAAPTLTIDQSNWFSFYTQLHSLAPRFVKLGWQSADSDPSTDFKKAISNIRNLVNSRFKSVGGNIENVTPYSRGTDVTKQKYQALVGMLHQAEEANNATQAGKIRQVLTDIHIHSTRIRSELTEKYGPLENLYITMQPGPGHLPLATIAPTTSVALPMPIGPPVSVPPTTVPPVERLVILVSPLPITQARNPAFPEPSGGLVHTTSVPGPPPGTVSGVLVAVEMRGYLANSPRELTVPVEANQR